MIIKTMKRKHLILLASLILIFALAVGGTLAYIATHTGSVVNTFTPAATGTDVIEDFKDNIKSDVKIANTGNIPVYIRAKVVITWKNGDIVLGEKPQEKVDYTYGVYNFPYDSNWKLGSDGYYYYTKIVQPEGSQDNLTGILIKELTPVKDKEGYSLSVEILAQSIQAEPSTAVWEAWGISVGSNGELEVPTSSQTTGQ